MIKEKFQLFQLMDWMIAFPDALQNSFAEKVKQYQAEKQMPLLSRIEQELNKEEASSHLTNDPRVINRGFRISL